MSVWVVKKKLSIGSSYVKPNDELELVEKTQKLEINILDSFTKKFRSIDLIKIDVEGFEYEVVKGAIESLSKTKYLLIEITLNRESNTNNLALLGFISKKFPKARIIKTGRLLGEASSPNSVDFLIKIN